MKNKTKMTVSEGLAKLKLLDKRINKETAASVFVGYKVGSEIQGNFDGEKAKSSLQSIQDLIEYRTKLKMAINKSNLKTKVKIAGKEMTVLEAIENKSTIDYKKNLMRAIYSNLTKVKNEVDYGNANTQERLDSQVQAAFEKANKKEIESFSETFLKNNGYSLEDPIKAEKVIERFDKEIDEFESEVDFVLSTSNATTTIEV